MATLNIHTPSTPAHLKITPTMVDDFLIDPVLAARILLGIRFDAFQAAAFRTMWWVMNVIDESGFGTGKSLRMWAWMQLRAILIDDHWSVAYYQTFGAGKEIFWPYYSSRFAASPYFQAQLGSVNYEGEETGKANTKGPACYTQHFKNGSRVAMPAPSWMQNAFTQAGVTFNDAGIDEWTKVEMMTKKTGAIENEDGGIVGGINQQILGRLRRACFNQNHPVWGNHSFFSATAESTNHPSQARINQFKREIEKGNPNYAIISFNFKDASNLLSSPPEHGGDYGAPATGKPMRNQIINLNTVKNMKSQFTRSHFMREVLGLRRRETRGWYSDDAVDACVQSGIREGVQPEVGRAA